MAAVWQEAGAGDGAMASRGVVTVVCFVRVYRDECVFISSRHGGGVAAALVGRAGGRVSLRDRRVDVSPGSGARGLHAGRPLGGRRALSRVRPGLWRPRRRGWQAGWLSRWRRASAIRPHTNTQ